MTLENDIAASKVDGNVELPLDAKLEYEYLWKRINDIDSKLSKTKPLILTNGENRNPFKHKGLIISFDPDTKPERPLLSLDDGYSAPIS